MNKPTYYEKHRETMLKNTKEYNRKHKKEKDEYYKKWYQKNKNDLKLSRCLKISIKKIRTWEITIPNVKEIKPRKKRGKAKKKYCPRFTKAQQKIRDVELIPETSFTFD